jgi:hypothetical protein
MLACSGLAVTFSLSFTVKYPRASSSQQQLFHRIHCFTRVSVSIVPLVKHCDAQVLSTTRRASGTESFAYRAVVNIEYDVFAPVC